MRSSEKRHRLIEYLNYLTHHEHKSLYPIKDTIDTFNFITEINIAQSTAYRIIKKYIDTQNSILYRQVNNEILKIYNN